MPLPLIPIAIGGLVAGAWWKTKHKKGLTPERKVIYETALESMKDPKELRGLADQFETQGLKPEAEMLRKRAALKELPDEVKDARKAALQQGLSSNDPAKVEGLANEFAKTGSTGAATSLRKYAEGLKAANPQPKTIMQKAKEALSGSV